MAFTNTYTSGATSLLLASDGKLHASNDEKSATVAQYLKGGNVQVAQGFDVVSAIALAWVAKTEEAGWKFWCGVW